MKNREEFRRTVLEKAARYEAERKNRNRKIRESILLCSICIVIAVSLYVGAVIKSLTFAETAPVDGTYGSNEHGSDYEVIPHDSTAKTNASIQTTSLDSVPETVFSDTTVTTPCTDISCFETTNTTKVISEDTTAQTTNSTETPETSFRLDFFLISGLSDSESFDTEALSIGSVTELTDYLNDLHSRNKIPQISFQPITAYYTDEYFETHTLIAVKMKDIGQCSLKEIHHSENGALSMTFRKSKNTGNSSQTNTYYYFITIDKSEVEQIEISIES